MEFINNLFGYPLGYIMWAIYKVVSNYGVAILLFTLVTKIILFPLSVKQQKSMARTTSLQPKIAALQKKYGNNKQKIQEEQMKLYSEEGVNPMGSCLPLLIQMPILFGIIDVVYRPMTHIMHFSKDIISEAAIIAKNVYEVAQGSIPKSFTGFQEQLYIMQAYAMDPASFDSISGFSEKVGHFSMKMFGGAFDLGALPTWTWPSLLIPVIAGASQLALTIYSQIHQKKVNPGAPSMGAMNSMMYVMPVVSVMMAFSLPAGVGFYWIAQSIFSLGQTIVLNRIYSPEKMAIIIEKEKKNKKKKGPSYMQRMMEQQQAMVATQNGGAAKPASDKEDSENKPEVKISKAVQKDVSSKVIADARRRYAEKYGDELDEN